MSSNQSESSSAAQTPADRALAWYRGSIEQNGEPTAAATSGLVGESAGTLHGLIARLAAVAEERGLAPWGRYAGVDLSGSVGDAQDLSELGMLPVRDHLAHKMYMEHSSVIWSAEELKFDIDAAQYAAMSPNNKRMYKLIVGFFQVADAFVSAQAKNYQDEAHTIAEEAFLATQVYMEIQHQHAYSLAATHVITDQRDLADIRAEVSRAPCVRAKWNYITRHRNSERSLGHRYLAGAFAEGVFFAALFAIIFCFRRKNLLQSFCTANQWIMRDETLHRNFNCAMAQRYGGFTVAEAHEMAREAYEIEVAHVAHLLAEPFDSEASDAAAGLTKAALETYARTLADQVLVLANLPPLFNEDRAELPWMAGVGQVMKVNFYEGVVTEYTQLSVTDAIMRGKGAEGAEEMRVRNEQALANPEDVDF